ncbi:MAG: SAM-dependent methyltransferase [Nitrososphaerota archaeon]
MANNSQDTVSPHWSEDNSALFLTLDDVAVPMREQQIATLCALIPAQHDETFTVVELGAGGGLLARAVLDAFPNCHYHALDGSEVMRAQLRERLASYGERVTVGAFELAETAWREELPSPLRCVVSSLVVHHLTGEGKRQMFADVARRLEPGGALLLADLVAPANDQARRLFAEQWNAAAQAQSQALAGDFSLYQQFHDAEWNYYEMTEEDPIDHPSPLADQLQWLRAAGFSVADCFWMLAGHAIYGGYR